MNDTILKILSLPKAQEKIAEAMGPWREFDLALKDNVIKAIPLSLANDLNHYDTYQSYKDRFLRIPLPMPMPGVEDKRTLWGMVDRARYRIDLHHLGATLTQMYSGDGTVPYEIKTYDTPYHALLLALCKQWGIEVKE